MRVVLRGKFKALRAYIERERDRQAGRQTETDKDRELKETAFSYRRATVS